MERETACCEESVSWADIAQTCYFLAACLNVVLDKTRVTELMESAQAAADADDRYDAMLRYLNERSSCPVDKVIEELVVDWTFLFRGIDQQGGPKPPYAGAWLAYDGVGVSTMLKINQYYLKAGLSVSDTGFNRLDYLGIQCEFIGHLATRIAEGDEESREVMASFMDEFIFTWLDAYVEKALSCGKTDFWKGYLELLTSSLKEIRSFM